MSGGRADAAGASEPARPLELSVVVPVYDEAPGIASLLRAWLTELGRLGVAHEVLVYDDGSCDGSAAAVEAVAAEHPQVVLSRHANRGHGPTILRGYREARGRWVAQVDGDGEVPPSQFGSLWELRDGVDIVIGCRKGRRSAGDRKIVSAVSRLAVRALFGRGIHDVNSPFRLYRGERLRDLLAALPPGDLFAPNVALAGLALRQRLRIAEIPVTFVSRRWGRPSLGSWKLWPAAARALRETVTVARARPPV